MLYEVITLFSGSLDHVGMEISDIAQVTAYDFPKADPEAPLIEIGMGSIDQSKPLIVAIGHNVAGVTYIMDYMEDNKLVDKIVITSYSIHYTKLYEGRGSRRFRH